MKALPRIALVLTLIGLLCPLSLMAKTSSNSNNPTIKAMKDQQNAHYLFVLGAATNSKQGCGY